MLAKLIGTQDNLKKNEMFKLNLFDTEVDFFENSEKDNEASTMDLLNIDLETSRKRGNIDKIINEMTITQEESEEDDLLSLMDKAS